MNYTLFHLKQMSLITIDQFEEFSEDYPELAQCYTFIKDAVPEDLFADTSTDRRTDPA
jgi:hypothetical protein